MLKQLFVVDYQEGAGGEYMASFISAHFGQELVSNPQAQPNELQKWLNTHSLVLPEWNNGFTHHLVKFISVCRIAGVDSIAIPYHLHKWPHHVEAIALTIPGTRFVRINTTGYKEQIEQNFRYKIWDRKLTNKDFEEIKFLIATASRELQISVLQKLKANRLTYKDLFPESKVATGIPPSTDVEILYSDFFVNFDRTPAAYETMCEQLGLTPNFILLSSLIERNKKNLQDLNKYLSTL